LYRGGGGGGGGGGGRKQKISLRIFSLRFKLLKLVLLGFWALVFFTEIRSPFVFRRKSGEMYFFPHSCLEMVTV